MTILNMIYWATGWGGWGWQPWANTLAYYKMNQNGNDETGNYNLSDNGTPVYVYDNTYSKYVLSMSGVSDHNYLYTTSLPSSTTNQVTIHCLCKGNVATANYMGCWGTYSADGSSNWIRVELYSWFKWVVTGLNSSHLDNWAFTWISDAQLTSWQLHSVSFDKSTWAVKVYFNWVLVNSGTASSANMPSSTWLSYLTIWTQWNVNSNDRSYNWLISEFIIEDKIRTDQEVSDLATEYWFTVS